MTVSSMANLRRRCGELNVQAGRRLGEPPHRAPVSSGSAHGYWNGYGTQCHHPAQERTGPSRSCRCPGRAKRTLRSCCRGAPVRARAAGGRATRAPPPPSPGPERPALGRWSTPCGGQPEWFSAMLLKTVTPPGRERERTIIVSTGCAAGHCEEGEDVEDGCGQRAAHGCRVRVVGRRPADSGMDGLVEEGGGEGRREGHAEERHDTGMISIITRCGGAASGR